MSSLKHGKLVAPSGTSKIVTVTTGANKSVDLLSWETEDSEEPQELEMLVYPLGFGVTGSQAAATFGFFMLELETSLGDLSTLTSEIDAYTGAKTATLQLPNNGLKMRFCARRARLRIIAGYVAYNVQICASFIPCRGMRPSCQQFVSPAQDTFTINAAVPVCTVIPKGARYMRAQSTDRLGAIRFYSSELFPTPTFLQEVRIAACTRDWHPIDPGAYFVSNALSSLAAVNTARTIVSFCVEP